MFKIEIEVVGFCEGLEEYHPRAWLVMNKWYKWFYKLPCPFYLNWAGLHEPAHEPCHELLTRFIKKHMLPENALTRDDRKLGMGWDAFRMTFLCGLWNIKFKHSKMHGKTPYTRTAGPWAPNMLSKLNRIGGRGRPRGIITHSHTFWLTVLLLNAWILLQCLSCINVTL